MTQLKGLDVEAAKRLGELVQLRGSPTSVLAQLQANDVLMSNVSAAEALRELGVLFEYIHLLGCTSRITLDLSLARGLDYYTGVIYEAVQTGDASSGSGLGSIAAGGRYDNLVATLGAGRSIPCVGVSIGVERLLDLLEAAERARSKDNQIRRTTTQVLVSSIGDNLLSMRIQVSAQLWALGVSAEYLYDTNPTPRKQLTHALDTGIPFVLWLGEDEVRMGQVKLKELATKKETTFALADAPALIAQLVMAISS
jgi:histidyl-tRNA synthetase